MKITRIEAIGLERRLVEPMRISRGGFTVRRHALVRVHTDAGITGLGEGVGNAELVLAILRSAWAGAVLGLDPFSIEDVRDRLLRRPVYFERMGSALCVLSAIEMACWDIQGKARGVPVYELLGAKERRALEVYVSSIYWNEDPAAMQSDVVRLRDRGFVHMKAHIGCAQPEDEAPRIEAMKRAMAPEGQLMIDLNAGYERDVALRAERLWRPYDLAWIEEPVRPDELEALAEIRAASETPIAAGENLFGRAEFRSHFQAGALDVAMPDVGRVGGLEETLSICALADASGVRSSPHNFSSGVLLAATMHVMTAARSAELLELDASGNAIYEDVLVEPLTLEGGTIRAPTAPGLGVALPEHVERRYAWDPT